MRLPRALPFLLAAVGAASAAGADDLSYVSDEELARELAAREADLGRTRARIPEAEAARERGLAELEDARAELAGIESQLAARAALLYRLSRQGGGLRSLLGPDAGTASLRRFATLKRLLWAALEQRRAVGLRLLEIEERVRSAAAEIEAARALEVRLEEAREELEAERSRRGSR
jgi:predicted  nucleic acid-binding Zn-ribbon protein